MSTQDLFLIPTVLEEICSNLTFEEAINLRNSLNLSNLQCRVPIHDKSNQIFYLDNINSKTISVYLLIKQHGSIISLAIFAGRGDLEAVKVLLKAGVDINSQDIYSGNTALNSAAWNGQVEIIKILLEDPNLDIDFANNRQRTALMTAVGRGHLEIVKILLAAGANVNALDYHGSNSLMMALEGSHTKIAEILIKSGININAIDNFGQTALLFAAQNGELEIVKMLLDAGANIDVVDQQGNTALSLARKYKRTNVVELLENY